MAGEPDLATLISRTAERDRDAFRLLYVRTNGMMMGIARKVLRRQDLAEEAVQDAYLTVWRVAHRFDAARGSPRGWMATIVRRRAIDRLRASPWLLSEVPDDGGTANAVELPETLSLRQCLGQLNVETRNAICLAYLFGMTHSELSDRTGIPLGTIKSRLRRGLLALRACLDP